MYQSILQLFPKELRGLFSVIGERQGRVNEIRLRTQKPILIIEGCGECFLDSTGKYTGQLSNARIITKEELDKIVRHVCSYSLYAFEEELRQGYVTVAGGHRIGMVGQVVTDSAEKVRTIKNICGVNIRISHQIKGVAEPILPLLYKGGQPRSILLVSAPGCGKTTLLRDIVRLFSDGNRFGKGVTVGVVDERSEIAGSYLGQPQNDVGIRTDVLDACPKGIGMMMLLRAMSPKVVAIDEMGSEEEFGAVHVASTCGSKVVATMHGNCPEDVKRRYGMERIWRDGLFEIVLFLGKRDGKCVVENIYEITEDGVWTCKEWQASS